VKVRIGLHTGEATRAGNDLLGGSVGVAARIKALATTALPDLTRSGGRSCTRRTAG
jgi:class 3 adenylate cyclase